MGPTIDYDHLGRYTGGDAALEAEVFSLFRNQIQTWIRLLEPQAEDEDWAAAAHSLKGSARGVGAMRLAEICERAEKLVGEAGAEGAREAARDRILTEAEAVNDEIAKNDYRRTLSELRNES